MMGKSHAMQGVCGVATCGAVIAVAPFDVSGLIGVFAVSAVLMVSGSTYPDIDAEGSHATKSYGPLSHLIHSITHILTQQIYHATLGPRDRPKKGSHRLLTHTLIGNLLAGLVLIGLCYSDRWIAAVSVGFLLGMAVTVWRKRWRWPALLGGILVAFGTYDPRWVWIWGVAFALGNMIHCFGDSCTKSGTPWLWPKNRNGSRWAASHAVPEVLRIKTGTRNEKVILVFTFVITLIVVGIIGFVGTLI